MRTLSGPTGLLAGQITDMGCYGALDLRKTKAHRGHAEAIAQGDAANWLGNHRADQEADYAVADQLPHKSEVRVFQERRTAAHTYLCLAVEALEMYDMHLKLPHNARSAAVAASRKPLRRHTFFSSGCGGLDLHRVYAHHVQRPVCSEENASLPGAAFTIPPPCG